MIAEKSRPKADDKRKPKKKTKEAVKDNTKKNSKQRNKSLPKMTMNEPDNFQINMNSKAELSSGMNDSASNTFRYIRNSSVEDMLENMNIKVSKQSISYFAGGLEFIASEILAESLRNSPGNRIVPKAIFKALQEDLDLNEFVRNGIILDRARNTSDEPMKLTGYQIE